MTKPNTLQYKLLIYLDPCPTHIADIVYLLYGTEPKDGKLFKLNRHRAISVVNNLKNVGWKICHQEDYYWLDKEHHKIIYEYQQSHDTWESDRALTPQNIMALNGQNETVIPASSSQAPG